VVRVVERIVYCVGRLVYTVWFSFIVEKSLFVTNVAISSPLCTKNRGYGEGCLEKRELFWGLCSCGFV